MKTAPPMNTFDFFSSTKTLTACDFASLREIFWELLTISTTFVLF